MSDGSDERDLLEELLEFPSKLGVNKLNALRASGWKLIAKKSGDLEQIEAISLQLIAAVKGKHGGRKRGSKAKSFARSMLDRNLKDRRVMEKIKAGKPKKAAVLAEYGTLDPHYKRIMRQLKEDEELTAYAALADREEVDI
jgi:hypothetical protein